MPFATLDQSDFYTMTVRGITRYVGGASVDFASECGVVSLFFPFLRSPCAHAIRSTCVSTHPRMQPPPGGVDLTAAPGAPGCPLVTCPRAAPAMRPRFARTALDQWERELQVFGALKRLKIFRLYKLWKSFRLWRKAVSRAKFSHAKASLEKNLFMLSPVFQGPMLRCAPCRELSLSCQPAEVRAWSMLWCGAAALRRRGHERETMGSATIATSGCPALSLELQASLRPVPSPKPYALPPCSMPPAARTSSATR